MESAEISGKEMLEIGRSVAHRLNNVYSWIEFNELVGVAVLAVVRANKLYDPSRSDSRRAYMYSKGYRLSIDDLRKNHDVHKAGRVSTVQVISESSLKSEDVGLIRNMSYIQPIFTDCGEWLRDLKPRDQVILKSRYEKGLSWREIGDSLGVTKSLISKLKTGALAELKKTRQEEFENTWK
jgi:RNA polymerase sigma factor (sigma-70 family)